MPRLRPVYRKVRHPKAHGLYEVSVDGRVRRIGATKIRSPVSSAGYHYISFSVGGKTQSVPVHQIVAWTFLGDPPSDKHVPNHKNGIRSDNRVENLEWVTRSENSKHALREKLLIPKGAIGVRNAGSKLTEEQVVRCREKYHLEGVDINRLVAQYGVAKPTLYQILRGETWIHVGGPVRAKGLRRGEDFYLSKLTEAQVISIRTRANAGELVRDLMKEYKIGRTSMYSLLRGETWGHVGGPINEKKEIVRAARISDEEVVELRTSFVRGKSLEDLAMRYSIHRGYALQLVLGKKRKKCGGPIVKSTVTMEIVA